MQYAATSHHITSHRIDYIPLAIITTTATITITIINGSFPEGYNLVTFALSAFRIDLDGTFPVIFRIQGL
jgi:hypothetical protein